MYAPLERKMVSRMMTYDKRCPADKALKKREDGLSKNCGSRETTFEVILLVTALSIHTALFSSLFQWRV